ncbi:MAG: ATP-binding protein [Bryobacteraceae bacterium]
MSRAFQLSPEVRAELMDPEGWNKVLEIYARSMKLAVALTDKEGRMLGKCHNPQPVWSLACEAKHEWNGAPCPFCLSPDSPCTAVPDALQTPPHPVLVHDQAGLVHIAAPLSLGGENLGALIAGQVFDRYPEPLRLQRVARDVDVPEQRLWHVARQQAPVRGSTLKMFGDLLEALGQAFLRQCYSDILERKLIETNRRFRLMIDGVKDYAIFTVDISGRVTSWNSGAERLLGYTEAEILGQQFSRIFTPKDVRNGVPEKELQTAAREGRAESEGWRLRKDGSRLFATGVLTPLGEGQHREFGKIMRDMTERRKTEQALLQAQKLESLGVLAGGIAHDFNNLLTGILGNASLLLDDSSEIDPDRDRLEDIVNASKRAAELTSQLLAYAGKGRFLIARFDLSGLVAEMLHLIQASIPKHVDLRLALAPRLPPIEADATQLGQIVMNLVINAAEAIGPEGGIVWVSTGLTGDARNVCLEVRDTGHGMDEATQAKIFDPFFSTKFTGRGLGLAAVGGIVRGHKGRLQVESAPGEGSAFRVFFPAAAGPVAKTEEVSAPPGPDITGTILVVEDEAIILQFTKAALERRGYTVLAAENGLEAVNLFREKAAAITAILLDLAMPVMGGEEAFKRITDIRPGVPVVVASGYSEAEIRQRFGDRPVASFIQKPYTAAQLAEKIRAVLRNRQK